MRMRSGLLLALLFGGGYPLTAETLYSVTDLGPFVGLDSYSTGLNNAGQVVGYSPNTGHSFLYSSGQVTDLGPLLANSINDAGQVTGAYSVGTGNFHAFLYTNGRITDLGTLGGGISYGYALNNAGQVTGSSTLSPGVAHAFLYSNGRMMDLGALPTDCCDIIAGYALNNAAQVTGSGYGIYAFFYTNGQMIDLGTLGGGRTYSGNAGNGINDVGQVTGSANTANGTNHAFLYRNGQMQDLGR
jgi:probable HAF family extracellular repeat protein